MDKTQLYVMYIVLKYCMYLDKCIGFEILGSKSVKVMFVNFVFICLAKIDCIISVSIQNKISSEYRLVRIPSSGKMCFDR